MGEEFFLKFFGNIGLDNHVVAVALTRERASSMSSLSQEKKMGILYSPHPTPTANGMHSRYREEDTCGGPTVVSYSHIVSRRWSCCVP